MLRRREEIKSLLSSTLITDHDLPASAHAAPAAAASNKGYTLLLLLLLLLNLSNSPSHTLTEILSQLLRARVRDASIVQASGRVARVTNARTIGDRK